MPAAKSTKHARKSPAPRKIWSERIPLLKKTLPDVSPDFSRAYRVYDRPATTADPLLLLRGIPRDKLPEYYEVAVQHLDLEAIDYIYATSGIPPRKDICAKIPLTLDSNDRTAEAWQAQLTRLHDPIYKVTRRLIELGATDFSGGYDSPRYFAAAFDWNVPYIQALSDAGIKMNGPNGQGQNLAHVLCDRASEYAPFDFSRPAPTNPKHPYISDHENKVRIAHLNAAKNKIIRERAAHILKILVTADHIDPEAGDQWKMRPIDYAKRSRFKEGVHALTGDPITLITGDYTPVEALRYEDREALDELLRQGATAEECSAALCNIPSIEIIELLIRHGANVSHRFNDDSTVALGFLDGDTLGAAYQETLDFCQTTLIDKLRLFLAHGLQIDAPVDAKGRTLLNRFCADNLIIFGGPIPLLLFNALLDLGADPNKPDLTGKTPLMYAAKSDQKDYPLVLELLNSGADAALVDNEGETALTYAATQSGAVAVSNVEHLLASGRALPGHANNRGQTALDIAVANNRSDTARLLIANSGT